MPGACARNLVHLTNDILEATLHWNEITMLEQGWIYSDDSSDSDSDTLNIGRSIYYLMINNESFMMTLPLLYNTCGSGSSGTPIVSQFTNFTSLFNNHIVESAKTVEYIDMALQMAIRGEWFLVGALLSHFLASFAHFIQLFSSAGAVTTESSFEIPI